MDLELAPVAFDGGREGGLASGEAAPGPFGHAGDVVGAGDLRSWTSQVLPSGSANGKNEL